MRFVKLEGVTLPRYVSMDGIHFQVLASAASNLATKLQEADLELLKKELAATKSDREKAPEIVKEFLNKRPWLAPIASSKAIPAMNTSSQAPVIHANRRSSAERAPRPPVSGSEFST